MPKTPDPSDQRLGQLRFTSNELPERDRHEAWVEREYPRFAPLFVTEPLAPFSVLTELSPLGSGWLGLATITGQRWTRDSKRLSAQPGDALSVNISLDIHARGEVGGVEIAQTPGSAVLFDLRQSSAHESTSGRSIQLTLSRASATEAGLDVEALHGLVLPPEASALLRQAALYLQTHLPNLTHAEGARAERLLLDLLVLSVASKARSPDTLALAQGNTLALRARAEIERWLGSPSLNVANLSRRLGVSRSTLHRAFDELGGVQAYIRNMRLDAARASLADPGNQEKIGDIAYRLGFADAAHFSRWFRARFGESPSDYRACVVAEATLWK